VSRKNLSRTVIEGGRYRYNRWDRRQSNGDERASTRQWIDRVIVDGDVADETVAPPRRHVYRSFYDKLAPAKRWLAAQVGRPWNKVYAELRARFDARTIAGQHVVNDHMLHWVYRGNRAHAWRHDRHFVVDAHGILRRAPFHGAPWNRLRKEADALAQGRRAANTYMGWWWFGIDTTQPCTNPSCGAQHEVLAQRRYHTNRFVPDRAMTRGELRRLDRLHPDLRARIVISAAQALAPRRT